MWKMVKLGDVCKITNGSTPLRKEKRYWAEGNIPWFTIDDLRVQGKNITYTKQNITQAAVDDKKVKLVPVNSVLLCCTASIGAAAIARVEMATNQQFNALTPKSAALNSDYLYFVATTLTQTLLSVSGSTTIKFVSMSKLKEISIPLPPLQEQERIVAKLDAAFAEIDEAFLLAQYKIADIQSLKNALLGSNLSNTKATEKLGDLIEIARGGSPRPIKSFITTEDDGVNWIKIGDTEQGGRFIHTTKQKIKPSGVSRSRYVKEGDFLLSNSMSFGRPYILQTDGCIHDGWLVLSGYQHIFSADYLYYLLSSDLVQNQFESLARGSTVRNLNIELVSKVIVPILPLTEQQRVVAKLDIAYSALEMANDAMEKSKRNYQALKSAILSQELQSSDAA